MIKRCRYLIFVVVAVWAVAAAQDKPHIYNLNRVSDKVWTGGQVSVDGLDDLKKEGVRAIINLRPPEEYDGQNEEARATALGLKYFNIPVNFREPKEDQATEFLKITDDMKNYPVFIHCAVGIRVGAFWMIRRVLRDGWTIEAAEQEAAKIGLRRTPHLREFAVNYIESHRKK